MQNISIVAIHGTFATDAPWTKSNSTFAQMLERELPTYKINWHFYNWSGTNTHKAREIAVSDLQRKLEELTSKGEEDIHLIAHSHGGNVALMTLCAPKQPIMNVRSVTCISTPFFIATPNDIEHFRESVRGSLTIKGLFFGSLIYFASLDSFFGNRFPEILAAGAMLYAVLLGLAVSTSAAVFLLRGRLSQEQLLQRYDFSKVRQPILSMRTSFDEAFLLLKVNAFFAAIPKILYLLVTIVIALCMASIFGIMLAIPLAVVAPLIY